MFVKKIKNYLLLLFLFLLPWQTRLIYSSTKLGLYDWEYGNLSLYGTELLLAVVVLLTLVGKFRDKYFTNRLINLSRLRLVKVILGMGIVLSLYLYASLVRNITWQYLNWIIYAICLAVIIIESKVDFKKLATCLWLGGLVQGGLAIYQFLNQSVWGNKWFGMAYHSAGQLGTAVLDFDGARYLRAYGSFGSPNSLGIYLGAIFLLGIILISQNDKNENFSYKTCAHIYSKENLWLLIGQIVILFGLFLTFARGAWLAVIFGIIILIWKNYKNILFWKQIVIYTFASILLLSIFKPLVFSRVDFQNRLEVKSISERVEQLQDFKTIFSKNILFGVGPGVYTYGLFKYHIEHKHDYQPVHNIFLLFLGEWGVVGLLGLFTGIYYLRKRLNWQFAPPSCVLVAGLFDHWSLSMFTGIIFFAVLASLSIRYSTVDTISKME